MKSVAAANRQHVGGGGSDRARFRWSALLWAMIYPRRRQRVMPTVSGVLLILLALGIGMAAYNAGNNILFITLALLLGSLVLSGVLSWLNFRRVTWGLDVSAPVRVGRNALVTLQIRNEKQLVPTYGLWFDVSARTLDETGPGRAETTFTARGSEVKTALAQAEAAEVRERIVLRARLDPAGTTRLEWIFQPARRGRLRIRLEGMGSLFPFGFLQKQFATPAHREMIAWPAPIEYRRFASMAAKRITGGERVAKPGSGTDLLALRRYQLGDSHRLIHWKASARTRRLLVRQFAAESAEGFALWLQTEAGSWTRPEQFELLVSFAATLAEDLFRAERLVSVALNAAPPVPVRGLGDLEAWLDELALVRTVPTPAAGAGAAHRAGRRKNLVTFAADGPRGVAAYCDGERMAAA